MLEILYALRKDYAKAYCKRFFFRKSFMKYLHKNQIGFGLCSALASSEPVWHTSQIKSFLINSLPNRFTYNYTGFFYPTPVLLSWHNHTIRQIKDMAIKPRLELLDAAILEIINFRSTTAKNN